MEFDRHVYSFCVGIEININKNESDNNHNITPPFQIYQNLLNINSSFGEGKNKDKRD